MHPPKSNRGAGRSYAPKTALQFARIDDQADLGSHLAKSERATTFVQIVQSCTVERCFLTSNDLKTHEVGRRAKNSRYILSRLGCYQGGTYFVQESTPGRWNQRRTQSFLYIRHSLLFVRILRHFANGIARERGYGWTDWKSFLVMRSGTYLNPG